MSDEKMNILFTSVGRRSYLVRYFKEELGEKGEVFAANSTRLSPAFEVADHWVITPLIYDPEYIPFLLKYCEENRIKAIISLFDVDLPVLSLNKEKFEEIGVKVLVSDPDVVTVCNDKWKTFQFLVEHGFHAPMTYLHLSDAMKALHDGTIHFPVMVKPRWGMGSIAVYEAEDMNELKVFCKKAERHIHETYLKYESDMDPQECVLIQEKLEGQEYGLDIINDLHGKNQAVICKMKYAMRFGETDCAVTVRNNELEETGRKLSNALIHIGNLDCDAFLTPEGVPYILEMNDRFGGGYPFSHMAGVNLPRAIISWLNGKEADPACFRVRENVMAMKDIAMIQLKSDTGEKYH